MTLRLPMPGVWVIAQELIVYDDLTQLYLAKSQGSYVVQRYARSQGLRQLSGPALKLAGMGMSRLSRVEAQPRFSAESLLRRDLILLYQG
jgi:hypothetical protein